jgi:hypothetical protein
MQDRAGRKRRVGRRLRGDVSGLSEGDSVLVTREKTMAQRRRHGGFRRAVRRLGG